MNKFQQTSTFNERTSNSSRKLQLRKQLHRNYIVYKTDTTRIHLVSDTVEPRYNEPLYTEVLGIRKDFLYPSNSEIYEKQPRYRDHFASPLVLRYIEVPLQFFYPLGDVQYTLLCLKYSPREPSEFIVAFCVSRQFFLLLEILCTRKESFR